MATYETLGDVPAGPRGLLVEAADRDGVSQVYLKDYLWAGQLEEMGLATLSREIVPNNGKPFKILTLTEEALDLDEEHRLEERAREEAAANQTPDPGTGGRTREGTFDPSFEAAAADAKIRHEEQLAREREDRERTRQYVRESRLARRNDPGRHGG